MEGTGADARGPWDRPRRSPTMGTAHKLLPVWMCSWSPPGTAASVGARGLTRVLLASGSHLHPGCVTGEVSTGWRLTCYDQLGVEEAGVLLQPVVVDVTSLGVDLGEEEEGSATLGWVKISCSVITQEGVPGAWRRYSQEAPALVTTPSWLRLEQLPAPCRAWTRRRQRWRRSSSCPS